MRTGVGETPVARNLLIWCLCLTTLLLFYGLGRLNPIANLFTVSLTPLPVYLAGRRLGIGAALLLALAVFLLIFSLKPGLAIVVEHLGFGELLLMGFLLSALESRGWSADWAIILTVVALTLAALLLLSGQVYLSGMTPREVFSRKTLEITEMLSGVFAGQADKPPGMEMLGVSLAKLKELIQSLLPALVISNTGLVAWINVVLARQLMVRWGWGNQEPPLYHWSAPEWFIFVVLATGFLLLLPVPMVRTVSMNLLVVWGLLYFCQGVAVVASWFQLFRVPVFLRVIGYLLMFLHPLLLLVITLGLADIWVDFRRLHQPLNV